MIDDRFVIVSDSVLIVGTDTVGVACQLTFRFVGAVWHRTGLALNTDTWITLRHLTRLVPIVGAHLIGAIRVRLGALQLGRVYTNMVGFGIASNGLQRAFHVRPKGFVRHPSVHAIGERIVHFRARQITVRTT